MTSVGIVVPTKNRADFMRRQLAYFAGVGSRHTVYIGDSSDGIHQEQMEEVIQEFQERVNIIHIRLPGLDISQAIRELLYHVSEPYAACSGDDDFQVPAALDRCAGFLDGHSDYSIAHGVAAYCVTMLQGDHLKVKGAAQYTQRALEHPTGGERLIDYLGSYFPVIFSVRRTQEFRRDMDSALAITDRALRFELLPCCLPIIRGKVKQLGSLYMVRVAHGGNYHFPDPYDWITSADWLSSVQAFRRLLLEKLSRQDELSLDEAGEVVKKALWSYLAPALGRGWAGRYGATGATLRTRSRRAARSIPMVSWAWHEVRSYLPGRDSKLSLPALLRPSSQYHADFMPIYRALVAPFPLTEMMG
jgi:glycosyltransferase domain-containing protein